MIKIEENGSNYIAVTSNIVMEHTLSDSLKGCLENCEKDSYINSTFELSYTKIARIFRLSGGYHATIKSKSGYNDLTIQRTNLPFLKPGKR